MTAITFFFIFIPILALILLSVNFIFAPHSPYQEKGSTFECGFHSFLGQNRTQFSISFFIFALLFLLFDLEILLVYPYVVSAYLNNIYGLIIMLIFFLVLTLGFAFELGKNALKIDSRQIDKNYVLQSNLSEYLLIKIIKTYYNKFNYLKLLKSAFISFIITLIPLIILFLFGYINIDDIMLYRHYIVLFMIILSFIIVPWKKETILTWIVSLILSIIILNITLLCFGYPFFLIDFSGINLSKDLNLSNIKSGFKNFNFKMFLPEKHLINSTDTLKIKPYAMVNGSGDGGLENPGSNNQNAPGTGSKAVVGPLFDAALNQADQEEAEKVLGVKDDMDQLREMKKEYDKTMQAKDNKEEEYFNNNNAPYIVYDEIDHDSFVDPKIASLDENKEAMQQLKNEINDKISEKVEHDGNLNEKAALVREKLDEVVDDDIYED